MKISLRSTAALSLCIALATFGSSCSKGDDGPTCPSGAGGNTSVAVFSTVNGIPVVNTEGNDSAYVKYGTTTFPGYNPASYDKVYVGEAGEDHIHLTNLKCGSYYILRTSYDTLRKRRFTGDGPITFTQTSGEIDTTIVLQ